MSTDLYSLWSRNSVIYQIYPRSFFDSNGDGIGDIRGIIEKLAYLQDGTENSLGIGGIWISPFFPSPMKDFGYDVTDYCGVDPIFGTMDDFDELLFEAKRRGIQIIIDFIPNHTSNKHPWFIESSSSRSNPKRDWYIWKDPKPDGSPPNNWLARFGGSAWTFDEKTHQYYFHSFLPEQPDLNWHNPDVRQAMLTAAKFWLDKGVGGLRLDAVEHLFKDPSFQDEPVNPSFDSQNDDPYHKLQHMYTRGRKESIEIVKLFCNLAKKYEDVYIVSEAKLPVEVMSLWQGECQNANFSPFNFVVLSLPWGAQEYRSFIDTYDEETGNYFWPNYFLGNHDETRIASRFGKERARLLAMMLLTLRGTPFVYYGEELGLENVPIPKDRIKDPLEKRVPDKNLGRDPMRTPMPWNSTRYGGFSKIEPWLPLNTDFQTRNVDTLQENPVSMLSLYKRLIHYRNMSPSLRLGAYRSLDADSDIFLYERSTPSERHLVILNFSDKDKTVSIPGTGLLICSTAMDRSAKDYPLSSFTLRPYEGCLFLLSH